MGEQTSMFADPKHSAEVNRPLTAGEKLWKAYQAMPPVPHTPGGWDIAKSGVSVNLPDGSKVRQEGNRTQDPRMQARAAANGRILAAAPTLHHSMFEALCAIVELLGDERPSMTVLCALAILIDTLAWVHHDPQRGRGLRKAIGLTDDHLKMLIDDGTFQPCRWELLNAKNPAGPGKAGICPCCCLGGDTDDEDEEE